MHDLHDASLYVEQVPLFPMDFFFLCGGGWAVVHARLPLSHHRHFHLYVCLYFRRCQHHHRGRRVR